MKILLTGGAGFIGSKIIYKLKNEHDIIVLDNFLEQIHGTAPIKIDGVTYVEGDVRNICDWELALSYNPDVIFHMASETGTGQSMDEINRYVTTNINGTSIMLDLINSGKYGIKKVILTSSRAVYGESKNIESNYELKPLSVYGVTKLTQEQLITTSCKVPYTILRYQNVFGDGQSLNNPYTGIISIFSNIFNNGGTVEIYDNGEPTRDFIYVDDIVNVTLLCMENNISDGKIYNVGTGIKTSILSMAEKLRDIINPNSKINVTNYHRKGDIMHANGDITKITNDLNWEPKIDIDFGLSKFVEWFKSELKN